MRKLFSIVLILATSVLLCQSQENKEPQFVGETLLVKDNNFTKLEKNVVKMEQSSMLAAAWGGKQKTSIEIEGTKSPIRTSMMEPIVLIIKAISNEYDPESFINVFKFDQTRKKRKAVLSKESYYGKSQSNTLDLINYSAEKYGEKSYKLILNITEPCEIGIILTNPENVDEKQLVVSCLGID